MFFEFFNTNDTGDKGKDTAVIMPLEGRSFPVDIHYLTDACQNYIKETVDTILKIHKSEPPGDVLAFLTGAVSLSAFLDLSSVADTFIVGSYRLPSATFTSLVLSL